MTEIESCIVEDIAAGTKNALVGGPFGSSLVSRDYVEEGVPGIRGWLLADLVRLANEHTDYSGTVEREGTKNFRLSYFTKSNEELIEDRRVAWNNGVRSLDSIAPRVLSFIGANGITAPDAETPGASVMAWVLRERLPPIRVSAFATSNAFDAIREAILRLGMHDFADRALQRLHRHDKFEEHVRRDELQASEAHEVQREKLKNACRRLKEAIKTYRAALSSLAWISLGDKDK